MNPVLTPPIAPMLARLEAEIPVGGGWVYEPKWDGFRGLIFKDATSVYIGSRNQKSLHPYFPELVEAALRSLPEACVLDGEIVVAHEGRLDFQALLDASMPGDRELRYVQRRQLASWPSICSLWASWIFGQLDSGSAGGSLRGQFGQGPSL